MCIIIYKKDGAEMPDTEALENCWHNNDDGAGIMYQLANEEDPELIHIIKGFMKFKTLTKYLKHMDFKKEDTVFMHFRTGTSGQTNKACCHPFPVSKYKKDLKATKITTNQAIMHNGICGAGLMEMSDTMIFVKEALFPIRSVLSVDGIENILELAIGKDRLAIFDAGRISLIGSWENEKETGLYYSNRQFKMDMWRKKFEIETNRDLLERGGYSYHNGEWGTWEQVNGMNNYVFIPVEEEKGTEIDLFDKSSKKLDRLEKLQALVEEKKDTCPRCFKPVKYSPYELDGIGVQCKNCKLFISSFQDFGENPPAYLTFYRDMLSPLEFDRLTENTLDRFNVEKFRGNVLNRIKNRRIHLDGRKSWVAIRLLEIQEQEQASEIQRAKNLRNLQDAEAGIERYSLIKWELHGAVIDGKLRFDLTFYNMDNTLSFTVIAVSPDGLSMYLNSQDVLDIMHKSNIRGKNQKKGKIKDTYFIEDMRFTSGAEDRTSSTSHTVSREVTVYKG